MSTQRAWICSICNSLKCLWLVAQVDAAVQIRTFLRHDSAGHRARWRNEVYMAEPGSAARHRLSELDAFRGIAALIVVFHHYLSGFNWRFGHSAEFPWRFDDGQYGVHLFFIISGFVILLTLEKTKTASDFVVARFARLYPAYWVAVLLAAGLLFVRPLHDNPISPTQVAVNLTMFQNLFGVAYVDGVYWTLSVELFFYALMLALWKIGLLRHTRLVAVAWIGANAIWATAVRVGWLPDQAWAIKPLFLWEFAHLFIAGMLFYRVHRGEGTPIHHALIAACFAMQWFYSWSSIAYVAIFFAAFYLFVYRKLQFIAVRPLVFLGTISYAVYLVHQILGYEIISIGYDLGVHPAIAVAVAVLCTLVLATGISRLVERPALAAVKEWWKRPPTILPFLRGLIRRRVSGAM